ncbi:hypothetical protein C7M84_007281 [Penaeus vannamei]|uniref:Uncharacterized protein n=1 Tax=Penaeus vannamei TaxID=6689 RepID=A0A3R7PJV8_PENVA|nr:hypothetical protein C7M84_007281 [Penaeus vannamei]
MEGGRRGPAVLPRRDGEGQAAALPSPSFLSFTIECAASSASQPDPSSRSLRSSLSPAGSQLYAFPIELNLPNSTLRLATRDRRPENIPLFGGLGLNRFDDSVSGHNSIYGSANSDGSAYGYAGTYGDTYPHTGIYGSIYAHPYGSGSSAYGQATVTTPTDSNSDGGTYAHGDPYSSSDGSAHAHGSAGENVGAHEEGSHAVYSRSIDEQRATGFTFLMKIMDNLGLDGRSCLLRAVCEVAEEPIADLGITGERLYPACPHRLMELVTASMSYFHHGLAHVGKAGGAAANFS